MLKNPMMNGTIDDFKFKDFHAMDDFLSQGESFANPNLVEPQFFYEEQSSLAELQSSTSLSNDTDSHENSEISPDLVLDFIDRMLMEEEMDDKLDMLQSHPALEATEKPFYELIGEKYPPSISPPLYSSSSSDSSEIHRSSNFHGSDHNAGVAYDDELLQSQIYSSQPSIISEFDVASFLENSNGHRDDFSDLFFKYLPASQFEKGVEEAKKFLPIEVNFAVDGGAFESNQDHASIKVNANNSRDLRQKSRHDITFDSEEQRSIKQSAISYEEPPVSFEMLDMALLCNDKFPKVLNAIREAMLKEAAGKTSSAAINEPRAPGYGRKARGKKKQPKEVVDLQTLLIQCAQTVSAGNGERAHELLRQIRQHSSPCGDSSQRVAHYFADGLDARLAGTGSEIYHALVSKRRTAGDVLKAYQLYLAASPFKNASYYFSNKTILDAIEKATRVHILDYGIYFGFQWPAFMKMLSARPDGPPKLRITGIDVPQPGFKPSERIEETGRRLSQYAERFGIPFEYQAVAAKLDQVKIDDLRLDEDEVLVINSIFRLHSLGDEAMGVDCARDKFLSDIRNLNPAIFVNVTANGNYGVPFFVTRFREALYHFSAMFDMLEMTVPREHEQRLLVERELYGKYAINVISCEGEERVERPESYRQTQLRCLRAGFEQLPVNLEFLRKMKCGLEAFYHKDFSIDEEGGWLLQGWRGRIFVALSAWKPS
ncbi:Scarecrow-like protein 14 [Platanthera guangdongensis]|uniref:Scarecrow-like protein 14 n=1 Tax=Platanthera guangdongensis TaxID=2320717 RepID=A0ABR2LT80_9ASPA